MVKDDPQIMTGYIYIYISTVASYLLTPQIATHVYASGGKTAPAFWPFSKTHIFYPSHAHSRYVTGFGGGDVNVHVNLRHMHV